MDFPREFPEFFDKFRAKALYLVIENEQVVYAMGDCSLIHCDVKVEGPVDVLDVVPALYGVPDDEGLFELVSSDCHSPVDIFYQRSGNKLLAYLCDARSSINAIVDKQQMRNEMHILNQELKAKNTYIERIHHLQTQFVSSISHEFRTPITSVLGNLDLVQKEYNVYSSFNKEALESAYGSASYLSLMINNVLDYASSSLNHLIITYAIADSRQLIHDIKQMFTIQAKNKNLDLQIDVADNVPDTFMGDAIRIKQVLVNLVSNAIKYTAEGSVSLNVKSVNDSIEFSVRDTGKGIAQNQQDKIFQPFVREESNQHMALGAGLGLTIAKTLVGKMKGKLKLSSKQNHGSEFTFAIPFGSKAENLKEEPKPKAPVDLSVLQGLNILVAEDNDDVADLLFTMLGLYGCKVNRATNGSMAIELAEMYKPDIIIMDINMPVVDGLEASLKIKGVNSDTPIVGLSASINLGEDLQQYKHYFDRLCAKPFKIDELVEIVCELVVVVA